MQMQQLARGFLAFDLTGVAVAVGFVAIGSGIPMLLASFGGLVVDRVPKRQLMIATESIMVVTTVIIGVLIAADAIAIWHLAILSFAQGATLALNLPARVSYITNLVNREQLPNAIALMNSGSNLTRVLGPSFAGLLIAVPFIGFAGTFFLMAALHALVLVLLMKIDDPGLPAPHESSDSAVREMTAGLRFIWTSPVLRTLIFLAFVPIILGMPYNFLLPVFAGDVLCRGVGRTRLDDGDGRIGGAYRLAGHRLLFGSATALADATRAGNRFWRRPHSLRTQHEFRRCALAARTRRYREPGFYDDQSHDDHVGNAPAALRSSDGTVYDDVWPDSNRSSAH